MRLSVSEARTVELLIKIAPAVIASVRGNMVFILILSLVVCNTGVRVTVDRARCHGV